MMIERKIYRLPDAAALYHEAAKQIVDAAHAAMARRGHFTIGLSGGETPAELYRLLAQEPYRSQIDWSNVYVYFGDERCVPPDHPESNFRMARETLLDAVPVRWANVFRLPGELPAREAIPIYEKILREDFGLRGGARPSLDVLLLGLGADGHVASLFPGSPLLTQTSGLVAFVEPPSQIEPPLPRLTLTLPVVNAASRIIFLVCGERKADIVRAALSEDGLHRDLPARLVVPKKGSIAWLLDEAACSRLDPKRRLYGQTW